MTNLYSDRAEALDQQANDARKTFEELFKASDKFEAQLIATAVVYVGELIAAAMYREMEKV
jgi:hypothetical protein